ncbi:Rho GTPase-activating protein 30 [Bagarius yarrelli]|uniref:Rho GTPase-activating protein 30 n=1 Tax=Bagarius yarrelli TaxID=175774 RepID=A0A556UHC0_BAGYA|nr:Rho GTPase-activating protein 30 [Bagarius yarrelli]
MKRGRRKGGSKEKVFGCDLVDHLAATSQEIPQVLRSCSMFIEEHGVVDGIYRLSGVSSNTQKLRSEFDNESAPDLYKDVYLQDIHCVSSLCKAYFRELPNPLLTYQLYDHFAEAVAVQLEEERLVKIREVLKDLPLPHFRTLEFLMKHLVRMATYSNLTNMHARNLAIVWAPNLLRSKDIEASGFNGTAAFMEVRVQSIVVEFILTHVSQLFPESDPEPGPTVERRKSLPSPSIMSSQEEHFFKALPSQYPGNMSPGDGPPVMRPYHAIIDGTDKRKGSLKGRKWKSIFNLGGRLHDPRKKKYAPKEKEKNALRPAKSMDSLSAGPYSQEDSRHVTPHLSPLAIPHGTAEGGSTGGGGAGSGYAVTYRRTGGASVSMVSGMGGAQGTYRSLDPGAGVNADKSQTPSQTTPSRAERRAGMHISGPFSVTVPLHITSGLALGVLQGGKAEEEEQRKQEQNEETQLKKDKPGDDEEKEQELDEGKVETEKKTDNKDEEMDDVSNGVGVKEFKMEDKLPEEARFDEMSEDKGKEDECLLNEQHATDKPIHSEDIDGAGYTGKKMNYTYRHNLFLNGICLKLIFDLPSVMKEVMQCSEEDVHQNESLYLPPEEETPDLDLPLDFQDTFGFLDLMDMPTSNQINEFSVEPPTFDIEEDEEENKATTSLSDPQMETSQLDLPAYPSRPLSNKSHSLPYKSYPFQSVLSFSSNEDGYSGPSDDDDDDDNDDSSDLDKGDYEDMFIRSLPSEYCFQQLNYLSGLNITLDSDTNEDCQNENQPECSNQTRAIPELIQDGPPASPSNDMNVIASISDDQCLNVEDLSPLSLETKHLNVERKGHEDKSLEDDKEDQTGLKELRNINELIPKQNEKMECTCSHTDNHSTEEENQEDIYYGSDPPVEISSVGTFETSCSNKPVSCKEPAGSEEQNSNTESESEHIVDVISPKLQSQNKTDFDTSVEGYDMEGVVLSEEREVGGKAEPERDTKETKEDAIIKVKSEEKYDEEQVDVDKIRKDSDMVAGVEQANLEIKRENFEKQKEGSDKGGKNDQQMEEMDDLEREIETQKGCYLEDITEISEETVPEKLNEEDDSLSEDAEERQFEKEKDSTRDEKHEDPSTSDSEKPMGPKTDEERIAGHGLGVGRTVIICKHKVYQVKAVPVVPPKPQHSKITAFRQQFQQRGAETQQKVKQPTGTDRSTNRDSENEENRPADLEDGAQNHDDQNPEQDPKRSGLDRDRDKESEAGQVKTQLKDSKLCRSLEDNVAQDSKEKKQRRGTWDGGSLGKDGLNELAREAKRTSGISMCFDEAVARATGKRYKEKQSMEKDRLVDLQ